MIEKLCLIFLGLFVGVPLVSLAGIRWSFVRRGMFVLSIATTGFFTLPLFEMSFFWDEAYRGSTRGLSIGLNGFAILALGAIVWHAKRHMNWWPRGSWVFLGVFVWWLGTGLMSTRPDYAAFEAVTLLRAYVLYWVLVNYFEAFGDLRLLMGTLAGVVLIQAALGAVQHLGGQYRVTGTLGDPNLLGMYLNMLLALLLAVSMESRGWWQMICMGAFLAGAAVVLITYSRGAWLVAAGTSTVVVGSLMLLNLRTRKLVLLVPCLAAVVLLLVAKADSILARWQRGLSTITESDDSARTLGPALAMVRDYPVTGVGLNNISLVLNTSHYGDQLTPDERQVTHNLYMATAAETGLVGLGLLLVLVFSLLARGARIAWRARRSPLVLALAVGATAAILSVTVHSYTEWVARVIVVTEAVAIAAAILAALQAKPGQSALLEQAESWS